MPRHGSWIFQGSRDSTKQVVREDGSKDRNNGGWKEVIREDHEMIRDDQGHDLNQEDQDQDQDQDHEDQDQEDV